MGLWVPPEVSRELVENRKRYTAEVLQFLDFRGPVQAAWNSELKKIDPLLALGKAKELIPAGFALVPGFYHLVRLNVNAPPTTNAIAGPDGEFAEPTSAMLDALRASDLQNARVLAERKVREENDRAEREKRSALRREERREELFGRVKAASRTQVLTSPDVPWSQNSSGRRGRK